MEGGKVVRLNGSQLLSRHLRLELGAARQIGVPACGTALSKLRSHTYLSYFELRQIASDSKIGLPSRILAGAHIQKLTYSSVDNWP